MVASLQARPDLSLRGPMARSNLAAGILAGLHRFARNDATLLIATPAREPSSARPARCKAAVIDGREATTGRRALREREARMCLAEQRTTHDRTLAHHSRDRADRRRRAVAVAVEAGAGAAARRYRHRARQLHLLPADHDVDPGERVAQCDPVAVGAVIDHICFQNKSIPSF